MADHDDINATAADELLARFDSEAPVDEQRVHELLDQAERGEGREVGDDFEAFQKQGTEWHARHRSDTAQLRTKAR